jgi:hypothetical protein
MATEERDLPKFATITVSDQQPVPPDTVEVSPKGGRVLFQNQDPVEYRLRLWKVGTEPSEGIDILLPSVGNTIVVIKERDEFNYSVLNPQDDIVKAMFGPIKN